LITTCAFFIFVGPSKAQSESYTEIVERDHTACENGDLHSCWVYSITLLAEGRSDELQVIKEKLCDHNFGSSCQEAAEGLSLAMSASERSARLNLFCKNGISGCAGALKTAKGADAKFFETRLRDQCESLANSKDAQEGCRLYATWLYKDGKSTDALKVADRVCATKYMPACETRAGILHLMGRTAEAQDILVDICPKVPAGQPFDPLAVSPPCAEVPRGPPTLLTWTAITSDLH
jgi:hypothetical protein